MQIYGIKLDRTVKETEGLFNFCSELGQMFVDSFCYKYYLFGCIQNII